MKTFGKQSRHRRILATIGVTTLAVSGAVLPATAAQADEVSNPYRDAAVYVNPEWVGQVLDQAAATGGRLARQMEEVATYPTAVWLNSVDAIEGGAFTLADHLDEALAQQGGGERPMVFQLVLYDIPGRDCAGRAAPGELPLTPDGLRHYRTEFIDPIVEILSRPEYASLRIMTIVEPGAVPNLLLGAGLGLPDCDLARVTGIYVDAIRYALAELSALPNAYTYLEASYAAIFGYPGNFAPGLELYLELVAGDGGPGLDSVAGFATGVSHYVPLIEPFLPDPSLRIGGVALYQSRFYAFNPVFGELEYARLARQGLISLGFSPEIGMLVDTGRNGWGGPDRPTEVSTADDVNTYVDESRVDRRPTRVSWCNQVGAGLGVRPSADPAPGVDAYLWARPPGESDGIASPAARPDPDAPYLRHRNACDPDWEPAQGSRTPSNALPGAPHFGQWFPELFAQLVTNAYPPVCPCTDRPLDLVPRR